MSFEKKCPDNSGHFFFDKKKGELLRIPTFSSCFGLVISLVNDDFFHHFLIVDDNFYKV
jgi:hypothetical protein